MLKGNNIHIRIIKEADLTVLINNYNEIDSHGEFLPISMGSEVTLRQQYNENGFVSDNSQRYVIANTSNDIIGSIWAFKSVPYFDAIEIGYQIFHEKDRGKGFVTEALTLFYPYIFKTKQINRLELRIVTENKASERVAIKTGFTLEGICREAAYSQGKHHDMNIFSMLRREWLAKVLPIN